MKIRTKTLRMVRASELIRDPRNPYVHTDEQRAALDGVLAEVGFAQYLGVRIGWAGKR